MKSFHMLLIMGRELVQIVKGVPGFGACLNLALLAVIIAVFGFVGIGAGALIPTTAMLGKQIYAGFSSLLIGATIGGMITLLIGFVNLKKLKR